MSVSCVSTWLILSQYNCSRKITNWRSRLAIYNYKCGELVKIYILSSNLTRSIQGGTYPNCRCSRFAFVRTHSRPFRTNHPSQHLRHSSPGRRLDWNRIAAIPPRTYTHPDRSPHRSSPKAFWKPQLKIRIDDLLLGTQFRRTEIAWCFDNFVSNLHETKTIVGGPPSSSMRMQLGTRFQPHSVRRTFQIFTFVDRCVWNLLKRYLMVNLK